MGQDSFSAVAENLAPQIVQVRISRTDPADASGRSRVPFFWYSRHHPSFGGYQRLAELMNFGIDVLGV